jgi:hypothetical protein
VGVAPQAPLGAHQHTEPHRIYEVDLAKVDHQLSATGVDRLVQAMAQLRRASGVDFASDRESLRDASMTRTSPSRRRNELAIASDTATIQLRGLALALGDDRVVETGLAFLNKARRFPILVQDL